jgi:hypothetical protein
MFKTITDSINSLQKNLIKLGENIKSLPAKTKELVEYQCDNLIVLKRKIDDLQTTNYNLGWHHLELGNYKDARFRFWLLDKLYNKNLEWQDIHMPRIFALILEGNSSGAKQLLKEAPGELIANQQTWQQLSEVLNAEEMEDKLLPPDLLMKMRYYSYPIVSDKYREQAFIKVVDDMMESFFNTAREVNDEHKILEVNPGHGELAAGIINRAPPTIKLDGLESSAKLMKEISELYTPSRKIYNKLHNYIPREFLKSLKKNYNFIFFTDEFYVDTKLELLTNFARRGLKKEGLLFAALPASTSAEQYEVKDDLVGLKFNKNYIEKQLTVDDLEILSITESKTKSKYDDYHILAIKRKK